MRPVQIQSRPLRQLLLWLPAAGWYGLISFFSSQNGTESTAASDKVLTSLFHLNIYATPALLLGILNTLVRKGAHMFIFFVLVGLLLLPLRQLLSRPARRYAAALALCAALAALDEYHQTFVPGRSGRAADVLVDLTGGACFLLFLWVVRAIRKRRSQLSETAKK